ncbi:MAG TPA: hypothetical protein VJK51_05070 [Candidatus Nanoarchaeia archaeon]|nr:hypothetical protein [Candidatus Nanoarchaeia archaeon]
MTTPTIETDRPRGLTLNLTKDQGIYILTEGFPPGYIRVDNRGSDIIHRMCITAPRETHTIYRKALLEEVAIREHEELRKHLENHEPVTREMIDELNSLCKSQYPTGSTQ